jgi:hypothetical protein
MYLVRSANVKVRCNNVWWKKCTAPDLAPLLRLDAEAYLLAELPIRVFPDDEEFRLLDFTVGFVGFVDHTAEFVVVGKIRLLGKSNIVLG